MFIVILLYSLTVYVTTINSLMLSVLVPIYLGSGISDRRVIRDREPLQREGEIRGISDPPVKQISGTSPETRGALSGISDRRVIRCLDWLSRREAGNLVSLIGV